MEDAFLIGPRNCISLFLNVQRMTSCIWINGWLCRNRGKIHVMMQGYGNILQESIQSRQFHAGCFDLLRFRIPRDFFVFTCHLEIGHIVDLVIMWVW
jgi:hypothetical protein